METPTTIIVTIINAILAAITLYSTRRKTGADATKTDAEASQIIGGVWKQIATELQEQLDKQDRRMDAMRSEMDDLHRHQVEQDKRLQSQDATIAEQGGIIMQLRQRVTDLENENAALKLENNTLRGGRGRL